MDPYGVPGPSVPGARGSGGASGGNPGGGSGPNKPGHFPKMPDQDESSHDYIKSDGDRKWRDNALTQGEKEHLEKMEKIKNKRKISEGFGFETHKDIGSNDIVSICTLPENAPVEDMYRATSGCVKAQKDLGGGLIRLQKGQLDSVFIKCLFNVSFINKTTDYYFNSDPKPNSGYLNRGCSVRQQDINILERLSK